MYKLHKDFKYIAIYYLFPTSNYVPKQKLWQHVLTKYKYISQFVSRFSFIAAVQNGIVKQTN